MAESRSALEILRAPDDWSPPPAAVIALVGDEPFLAGELLGLIRRHLVPDEADRSWAWREFDGEAIEDPRDIFDEAATVPMFAGATRVAVVRTADPFVTKCRATLETIVATPRGHRGLVILDVKTFPATTRLAKTLAAQGAVIDLAVSAKVDLAAWVRHWAKSRHGCALEAATAQRLLQRLNNELGQIDQAVQRLAGAQGKGGKPIPPEAVDDLVGSPQERSAWGMIDAAAAGNAPEALAALAERLSHWALTPTGTEGYRKAEVTAGGVDTRALSSQTMESRQPGLYFIGEVVDVTGWLGGYNFQWAWASGFACAQGLAARLRPDADSP